VVSTDPKDRARVTSELEKLEERDRERVLAVLAEDSAAEVLLAAIPHIKRLKDRIPAARAVLVKLIQSDESGEVREAAREALGGGK